MNFAHKAHYLLPLCMTQVGDPIAIVVSLTVYSEEPASTEDGQLSTYRCERAYQVVFYDCGAFKELSLQAHQRQLLELLDTLFRHLVVGIRHDVILPALIDAPWLQPCRPCLCNHTRMVELP